MVTRGAINKNGMPKVKDMKAYSDVVKTNIELLRIISEFVCKSFDLDLKKCEAVKFRGHDLAFARSSIIYMSKKNFRVDTRAIALYFGYEKEDDPEGKIDDQVRVLQRRVAQVKYVMGVGRNISNAVKSRYDDQRFDRYIYNQMFNYAVIDEGPYNTLYDLLTGKDGRAKEFESKFKQFSKVELVRGKGLKTE